MNNKDGKTQNNDSNKNNIKNSSINAINNHFSDHHDRF